MIAHRRCRRCSFWKVGLCCIKPSPLQKVTAVMKMKFEKAKLRLEKDSAIFSIGAVSYSLIEILWRHYTHWTMAITGGLCFVILFRLFNKMRRISMIKKCAIGSGVITSVEFAVGCIVNIGFKMNVWDYSAMPLNLFGQICIVYSFLWGLLSIPIVFLSDKLRTKFFVK